MLCLYIVSFIYVVVVVDCNEHTPPVYGVDIQKNELFSNITKTVV